MYEELVWDLHLALHAAPGRDSFYAPSVEDVEDIRSYTDHNEDVLAFDLILAIATPNTPAPLREHACRIARLLSPNETNDEADGWVDQWLRWKPASGAHPPYRT